MEEKIRIIIADDNVGICDLINKYLQKYSNIEIVGIANDDETEIKMIEELNPDIVITDLVRNWEYTGLDIIKEYNKKKDSPEFLVISADEKEDVIRDDIKIGGYIKKPFRDYSIVVKEIERINNKKGERG